MSLRPVTRSRCHFLHLGTHKMQLIRINFDHYGSWTNCLLFFHRFFINICFFPTKPRLFECYKDSSQGFQMKLSQNTKEGHCPTEWQICFNNHIISDTYMFGRKCIVTKMIFRWIIHYFYLDFHWLSLSQWNVCKPQLASTGIGCLVIDSVIVSLLSSPPTSARVTHMYYVKSRTWVLRTWNYHVCQLVLDITCASLVQQGAREVEKTTLSTQLS